MFVNVTVNTHISPDLSATVCDKECFCGCQIVFVAFHRAWRVCNQSSNLIDTQAISLCIDDGNIHEIERCHTIPSFRRRIEGEICHCTEQPIED